MDFLTKIAVLLRDDLAMWQKLNVTAFLAGGISGVPGLLGDPYIDADHTRYLPMLRQPVLIYVGDAQLITAAHERAVRRGLAVAVFIEELFDTGHDEANRAAVRAVARAELKIVGLAVHGSRNAVDKVLKGAVLHP